MKLKYISLIAALPMMALTSQARPQKRGDKIANSYICVFKTNAVSRGNAQAEANRSVHAAGGQLKHVYSVALQGLRGQHVRAGHGEHAKRANANIAYCEQDQVVTTGPIRADAPPGGGGGTQPAQETPWGIARVGGGGAGHVRDRMGHRHRHRLHAPRPQRRHRAQPQLPWRQHDAGRPERPRHPRRGHDRGHDNTIGVIGVAPGATVVAVRVLDRRGSGTNSGVIAGVDYVAAERPGRATSPT